MKDSRNTCSIKTEVQDCENKARCMNWTLKKGADKNIWLAIYGYQIVRCKTRTGWILSYLSRYGYSMKVTGTKVDISLKIQTVLQNTDAR